MKRLFSLVIIALIFAGCGKTEEPVVIDLDALAADIFDSDAFSETLELLDPDLGELLYGIDPADISEELYYLSTGATAEELVFFNAVDAGAAERIVNAANARIEAQAADFKSYLPSEVPKLEKAEIYTVSNYVILCVADDIAAAKAIIDEYIG